MHWTCQQLELFITGEGGTGKSKVIEAFFNFTRKYYGKTDELYGPIIVTAPTGTFLITSRILGATIIVIDEISLTSLEDFYKQHIAYSRALSTLTECQIEKQQMLDRTTCSYF